MHWNVNNPTKNGEDLVMSLNAFFKFNVLIPERMRKEVKADTTGAALKESVKRFGSA
jgi:hypothetical protein